MSDDRELRRVAAHEAGHAASAWFLGRRSVGPVSIVPTDSWAGVCLGASWSLASLEGLGLPIVLLPAATRRSIETHIIVTLAGREAEYLTRIPTDTGYVGELPQDEADEARALELAALASPSATDARLLAEAEGKDIETDEDTAHRIAYAATGDGYMRAVPRGFTGGPYLEWVRAETRAIVAAPEFTRLARPLIEALLAHRVLSRRAVREILTTAHPLYPRSTMRR